MSTIITNAESPETARNVAALIAACGNRVRFASFSTRHAGKLVGEVRFGDDEVHAVVMVGVDYKKMVERSISQLEQAIKTPDFFANVVAAMNKAGIRDTVKNAAITLDDVKDAISGTAAKRKGLIPSLYQSSLGINPDNTNWQVYSPLEVDGEVVPGCKVYTGDNPRFDDGDELAPMVGAIYIEGVTISKRVITPAPNGPAPKGNKGAVVQVKEFLCDLLNLPHAKFRMYRLHPETPYLIQSGNIFVQ